MGSRLRRGGLWLINDLENVTALLGGGDCYEARDRLVQQAHIIAT